MPERIASGWFCLWESHPGGVGVPCVVVDGIEMCAPCAEKHAAERAAEGRKGAA